jgi:hypothetical protein
MVRFFSGVLFFLVFVPIAFILRAFGKKLLSHGFEPRAETYWTEKRPDKDPASSMRRQF